MMNVRFKRYCSKPLFGTDYEKLRQFLIKLDDHNYPFGRWDWMITHGYLDKSGLDKIGLWEADGEIVAVATYDCSLGQVWLLALDDFKYLRGEMLVYARQNLTKDDLFKVLIADGDLEMQNIAVTQGYRPTQSHDFDSVLPIDTADLTYELPEGFRITSMKETYDLYQYGQVLWRGFNHELNGEGPFPADDHKNGAEGFERPHVNLDLKIAVVAPNGDFVSYCGMWLDAASENALVEPVATDPAYRMMGLGRAAVLEAVRRCGELGAKRAYVGSSQQFYYNIGFRPYSVATWWEPVENRTKG